MLDQGTLTRLISECKKELGDLYGSRLKAVYLYGSYARGEAEEGSDIDVAVVLDDFQSYWEEVKRTGPVMSKISLQYEVSVSLFRIREREWRERHSPILDNIRQTALAA